MQRILLWAVTVVLAVAGAVLFRTLRPERPRDPLALIADTLQVLRVEAESCRAELDSGAARLDAYDARVDSLRRRVRAFEAIDPRGVPADSYAVYLDAFEQYNDSAAGWGARADTLRARLGRCRGVTERHNLLADSLRQLLIEQQPQRPTSSVPRGRSLVSRAPAPPDDESGARAPSGSRTPRSRAGS